ncbi:MAG: TolC family protein [Calditrichaeota bacterium]|nr:TolC family protein [Calditrichota bacterium]
MNKLFMIVLLLISQLSSAYAQETFSLSLEEAKKIALQNNPFYQMKRKNIDYQKGIYWAEMTPENPEIGIEVEEIPKNKSYTSYGEKRLVFSQSLDFPTNYIFRHKLLRAEIQQKYFNLQEFERELSFQVKDAYFTMLMQQGLVELSRQNLKLSQDFFDRAKQSYELGDSDRLAMLKAKVNLSEAQRRLIGVQKDLDVAESVLREVLGLKNNDLKKIVLSDSIPDKIKIISYKELKRFLPDHPAIRAAQSSKISSLNAKRLAYAGFLPQISFSYFNQEIDKTDYKGGEISLSLPLWFMGQKGRVQYAKAQLEIADQMLISEELRLQRKFDQATANLEKATNEVTLYQTNLLSEAEEVFRIAQESYRVGEIGYLQFIDAQQTLIQTRAGYLQSLRNYQIEIAHLEKLVGVEL